MKRGFVRQVALNLLGASTARAILFLVTPIAARLYSKEDFGGLALVMGLNTLLVPILTLRYEIAIMLARTNAAARAIFWLVFIIAGINYGILAVILIAAPGLLSRVIEPSVIEAVRAPFLTYLGASLLAVPFNVWLQRRADFRPVAFSQLIGALVIAGLVVSIPAVTTPSLSWLIWAYAAGALASAAVLAYRARAGRPRSTASGGFMPRRVLLISAKYSVYPLYTLPLTLSSLVSDRLILLYLSTTFSLATLGGYFSIRQILFGLVVVVSTSFNQVVFAHLARMQNRFALAKRPLLTMTLGFGVVAGLGLGWIIVYATEVTRILLGDRWLDAAELLPWIAIHGAVVAVTSWQDRFLAIEGKPRLDAVIQIARDAVLVLTVAALWASDVSAVAAIATVAAVSAAHGLVLMILVYQFTGLGAEGAINGILLLAVSTAASGAFAVLCRDFLGGVAGMILATAVVFGLVVAAVFVAVRDINRNLAVNN